MNTIKKCYNEYLKDLEDWKYSNGLLPLQTPFFKKYDSIEDFQRQIKTSIALILPVYQLIAIFRALISFCVNLLMATLNLACFKPIDCFDSVYRAISCVVATMPLIFIPFIHAIKACISIPTRFITTILPCIPDSTFEPNYPLKSGSDLEF